MISVSDFRDYLKTEYGEKIAASAYVSPVLNMKDQKVLCFQTGHTARLPAHRGIFSPVAIDIYVHWSTDYEETQKKAQEIYDLLLRKRYFSVAGHSVSFLNMLTDAPEDAGKDPAGIYNRVISFDLAEDEQKKQSAADGAEKG